MKQLSKIQSTIYILGGVLMTIGAGSFAFLWHREVVCWIFLIGAILFTLMQSMQVYDGNNFIIKRLKRIQSLADIFFVLSAILMVDTAYMFFRPMFNNLSVYQEYFYNKWVILLLVASILEVYTTHRIDSELKKEKTS